MQSSGPRTIRIGNVEESFSVPDIQKILAGYAFATEPHQFDAKSPMRVGDPPEVRRVPVWAYRSYDCVRTTSGPVTPTDILVVNGLNGRLNANAYHAICGILPELNAALASIPLGTCFWKIDPTEIEALPAEGTTAWWVWRAWWLLARSRSVGPAITHKLLHHKRPTVFPLLDNQTLALLTPDRAWIDIHDQLTTRPVGYDYDVYEYLERWFAELAARRDGVAISRLRIHDIVLWCTADGARDTAMTRGTQVLDERGPLPDVR